MSHFLDAAEAHPSWRDYRRRHMEKHLAEARTRGENFMQAELSCLIEFNDHLEQAKRRAAEQEKQATEQHRRHVAAPPAPAAPRPASSPRSPGMTWEDLGARLADELRKAIAASETRLRKEIREANTEIVKCTDQRIGALVQRIDTMSEEMAVLKAAAPTYKGVWDATEFYRAGSMVTQSGSIWFASQDAAAGIRPGASAIWQLAVKRGRDGRDGLASGRQGG
jgi:hypothetical protein